MQRLRLGINKTITALTLIIFLISIPFGVLAADGENPIEDFWVEEGLIHIEGATSDSIYENPSLAVDEFGDLWLSYSNSSGIYIVKQSQDTFFEKMGEVTPTTGSTLSEHHYSIINREHIIVASIVDCSDITNCRNGIEVHKSQDGYSWNKETTIFDQSNHPMNNPWLTKTGTGWMLYWDQPSGKHNSILHTSSTDLKNWDGFDNIEIGSGFPVFTVGTYSSHDTHPTSIYIDGIETLVWTSDKFDNHEFMGSDVEKTVVFSQRNSGGEWSSPQPISNQFGNDENPSLTVINNNPVVVWDSDRTFSATLESEGIGHGGTNLWYSTLLDGEWTQPACISIQEMHKSSPDIIFVDGFGIVVTWEETEKIHMTHTINNENLLPLLESFDNSISISKESINEEIHIDKPTRIHRDITITNDGDFILRGDIESTKGLTVSHHLIELNTGQSMQIKISANLDPLDDFHGVITLDTNAGLRKISVDFHTIDTNKNQLNPLEEVSEGDDSGIIKLVSKSNGDWFVILLLLIMVAGLAVAYKENKDKKANQVAAKAVGIVAIMILMSFTPMIENAVAEEVETKPFLDEPNLYDLPIYPNQDFNLSWPMEVVPENLIETTLTSHEYSNPPKPLAQFPNCWDSCDQRLWELEILKQELSYNRWVNINFEIKGSVDSYPFIIFQQKDRGSIEYYNLSSILGGINGEWQQLELDLQGNGSFLSRTTGDANMYIVSPILEFDNPRTSASLVIKTIGQDTLSSIPELNASLIPINYKSHYNSGNSLTTSKIIDGERVNLLGNVDRFPVASFPTDAEKTYNPSAISETDSNLTDSQLDALNATIQNSTNFDIIIKEYENYKWFNSPIAQGDNMMPSSGWQECGNGEYLCPAGATLDSSSTQVSASPFTDSDWLIGTYDNIYSRQYMYFEHEVPAPQISSVMLNSDSDPNGNRLVYKNQTLTFDIRIAELYQGLESLTFEASVVNVETQKVLGVIGTETVNPSELEAEYAKAITNEESSIQISFTPSEWYYPSLDNENEADLHRPVFMPYGQYALVVTYADTNLEFLDNNNYALGKWGVTDNGSHFIREELLGSLFVIQPGPVVTDANLVLPNYTHLNTDDSTKLFILDAKDSAWDGVGTRDHSKQYFISKLTAQDIDYHIINSTSELELLINSDIENAMIINTHGPILPAPTSYFTDHHQEKGLLGEWDFEPYDDNKIIDSSPFLNHGEMNGGQRSYDSTQGALALFLNETSIATIKDLGSSVVWEIEIGDDSSIFCISNDGAEPTLKANITNPTGYSDCYHTSNDAQNATSEPLYPVENYRVSLDLKFLAPHDDPNPLSVLNYGVLSDQFIEENFWDVKYDASKQELHLFSTFFEHEDDNPALTVSNVTEDKWYKLDLVFDELGVTIYLDSERASETAIWKNVEELNDIKDSKITGFQISDSGINMLIDQLWISSEASNPKDGRSVSSVDITNSKNWIGRIGHWMAEQSGIWVQPTGLAFSVISNNQVGWDGDKIEIGVEGLETFMQKFGAGTTEDIIIDDDDDPISWHNYEACQWEGATFAGDIRWYCQDEPDKQTQIVSNITLTSVGAGYPETLNGIALDSSLTGTGLIIDLTASPITHNFVESISPIDQGALYNPGANNGINTYNFGGVGVGLTVDFDSTSIESGKVKTINLVDNSDSSLTYKAESNIPTTGNGNGTGLTVDIIATPIIDGVVETHDNLFGGTGYVNGINVATTGNGTGLTVDITASEIIAGEVVNFVENDNGSGYTDGTYQTRIPADANGTGLTVDITVPLPNMTISANGNNYLNGSVTAIGGTGYGIEGIVTVNATSGSVTSFEFTDGGQNYLIDDIVTLVQPNRIGDNATITLTTAPNGAIGTINVNNPGSGYTVGQVFEVEGGNFDARYCICDHSHLSQSGGVIESVNINNAGSGYSVDDLIIITEGDANAFFNVNTITSTGGTLGSIEVNNIGIDYVENETLQISNNNNIINIAVDKIYSTGGQVSNISINNAGSGYQVGDMIGILDDTRTWNNCGTLGGITEALEHRTCYFEGTRLVRYGTASEAWTYQYFTDNVECNNLVFGDPAVGHLKKCEVLDENAPLATFHVLSVNDEGGEIRSVTIVDHGAKYQDTEDLTIPGGTTDAIIKVSTETLFDDWWYYCENGTNPDFDGDGIENNNDVNEIGFDTSQDSDNDGTKDSTDDLSFNLWYCTDDLGQEIIYQDSANNLLHTNPDVKLTRDLSYFGNPNSDNFVDQLNWDLKSFLGSGLSTLDDTFTGNITGHKVRTNIGMVDILSHDYFTSTDLNNPVGRDSLTFYHPVQTGGLFYHGGVENQLHLIGDDVCQRLKNCVEAQHSIDYNLEIELVGHKSTHGKVVPGGNCNLQGWGQNYVGISEEDYNLNKNAFATGEKIYFQGNWYFIDGVDKPSNCNHPARLIYVVREASKADGNIWTFDRNGGLYNFVEEGSNWHVPSTMTTEILIPDLTIETLVSELRINYNDWLSYYNDTLPFIWENIHPLINSTKSDSPLEVIYHIDISGFSRSHFGINEENTGSSDSTDFLEVVNDCPNLESSITCNSYNIVNKIQEDNVNTLVIPITTTDHLNDLIHSNIKGSYVLNSHADNLPIHSDYFTGIQPVAGHKFLYDFELDGLGEISNHIYDRSGNNADARLVKQSIDKNVYENNNLITIDNLNTGELVNDEESPVGDRYFSGISGDSILTSPVVLSEPFTIDFITYLNATDFTNTNEGHTTILTTVYQNETCLGKCWHRSVSQGGAEHSEPTGLPSINVESNTTTTPPTLDITFIIGEHNIIKKVENGWNHVTISKSNDNIYQFYVNSELVNELNIGQPHFPIAETSLLFGTSNNIGIGIDHISVSNWMSQGAISKSSVDYISWFEQFGQFIHSGNTLLDMGGAQLSKAQGEDMFGNQLTMFGTEETLTMEICVYNARFSASAPQDGGYTMKTESLTTQSRSLLVKDYAQGNCKLTDQFAVTNNIDSVKKLNVFKEQFEGTIPFCVANLISNSYANHWVGGHVNIPVLAGENLSSLIFPDTEQCTHPMGIWTQSFVFYAFKGENSGTNHESWTSSHLVCFSYNNGIIQTEELTQYDETRIMTIADSDENCNSPGINLGGFWADAPTFSTPDRTIYKTGLSDAFSDYLPEIYRHSTHHGISATSVPEVEAEIQAELIDEDSHICTIENLSPSQEYWSITKDCYNKAGRPSGVISVGYRAPLSDQFATMQMKVWAEYVDGWIPIWGSLGMLGLPGGRQDPANHPDDSVVFEVGGELEFSFSSGAHGTLWTPNKMTFAIPLIENNVEGHYLIEGVIPVGSGCIISSTSGNPSYVGKMGSWCRNKDPRILYNIGTNMNEATTDSPPNDATYFHPIDIGTNGPMILQMLETHSDGNIIYNHDGSTLPMPNELFENDLTHNAITISAASDPSFESSNKFTANRIHSTIFSDASTYLCQGDEVEYSISTPMSSYNQYLDTTTDDDMRPQIYLELEYEIITDTTCVGQNQQNQDIFDAYTDLNSVGLTRAASDNSPEFSYSETAVSPGAPSCETSTNSLGRLTSQIRGAGLGDSQSLRDANELKITKIKTCIGTDQMIRVVNWALTFGNDHQHGYWEATISNVNITRTDGTKESMSEKLVTEAASDILGIKPYHGLGNASIGYDDSKTRIETHNFRSYISNYISDFASFISRNGHAYYGHLDLAENHMPFEFIDVYDKEGLPHQEHIGHYGWSEFMEPRTDAHHLIWASELSILDVHTQNLMDNKDHEDAPILPLEIDVNDNTNPNFLWIQNTNKDILSDDVVETTASGTYSKHAWIRLGHGSIIHSGDSNYSRAMLMASKFVSNRDAIINNYAGEYSKGQTIFVDVSLDNFMTKEYGEQLNVTVYMNVKSLSGGAVSERIASYANVDPMFIDDSKNIILAWNIHENVKIGDYSFTFDVVNTDTKKYIDTYGQSMASKIGVSVISDVQLIHINRKVTTGIYDKVEIEIDLRNNMYVESEILAQAIFTAENKHMYWSDEFTNTCDSSSLCEINILWDPAAQNYHNQSFNIGSFSGKIFIEDAVSKYVTESSLDGEGHPSHIRTPAIIDLDHFEMELLPEFELIFPNIDGLWKYKFDEDSAWTFVGRNYKLLTQKDITSLQIQKVHNSTYANFGANIIHERFGDIWALANVEDNWQFMFNGVEKANETTREEALNALEQDYKTNSFDFNKISNDPDSFIKMRYLTSTPSALRMTYSIYEEVEIDTNTGDIYKTSNKLVTNSFSSDGTEYTISNYALLNNSIISISTEPYFAIATHTFSGDMSAYGFTNVFDRHYTDLPSNLRLLVRGASTEDIDANNEWNAFMGKGFSMEIAEKGYYKLKLTGSTINHKLVILSESYWDANNQGDQKKHSNRNGPKAIEITDLDWNDKSKVKYSTEMHGNKPVTLTLYPGDYYFLILTNCVGNYDTGTACDLDDKSNIQNALQSFRILEFQKIAQLDVEKKEGCPGIGYTAQEANERIDALEEVGVTDCQRPPSGHNHDKSQSGSVGTSSLGPTGATASSLPAGGPNILDELTKFVKVPLFGANADSSGPSFEHSFGDFAAVSVHVDWVNDWDSEDADGIPMQSHLRLRMGLSGEVELEGTGVVITYSLTVDVILMKQFFTIANCVQGQIIYVCNNLFEALPHIGNHIAFNVEFTLGVQIPIGKYIWGTPINIEVESGSHTYFELKLEIYINLEVKVDVYNKNLCLLKKDAFEKELKVSDIPTEIRQNFAYTAALFAMFGDWNYYNYYMSGAGQKALYSEMIYPCDHIDSVGLRVEFSLGVRLSFEFSMNFRIKHIYHDLSGKLVVKNNEKVVYESISKDKKDSAQLAEKHQHDWIEREHNKADNFETRGQLEEEYKTRMASSYNKLVHANLISEQMQNQLSSIEKSFNETEKYWKIFKHAKWVNFDGDFSLGFEIGITIHVVIQCDGTPCKSTVDISFFLHFHAGAHFKVWFFHVGITLDLTINKVVWAVQIGGSKGWKVDPTFGTVMFCDKGYDNWGYPKDASEWISTSPSWAEDESKLKITAAGFVHINIGIPNANCFKR